VGAVGEYEHALATSSGVTGQMAEDHRESDHSHALSSTSDMRYVLVTLGLISAFLVGEVIAAVLGHSLALFADAAHMSTDVVALTLSAWAITPGSATGRSRWTFGLQRAEILSAAATVSRSQRFPCSIARRAIQRLINPITCEEVSFSLSL